MQDVRATIDFIHVESMELKKVTVKDLPRYHYISFFLKKNLIISKKKLKFHNMSNKIVNIKTSLMPNGFFIKRM